MTETIEFLDRSISRSDLERVPRLLEPEPSHRVYIVSFPKTGRTWTRVLTSIRSSRSSLNQRPSTRLVG